MAGLRLVMREPGAVEAALSAKLAEFRQSDPLAPVYVVIGSWPLRWYLGRRLARQAPLAGVRFVTFRHLAMLLGRDRARAAGLRLLPRGGERLLATSTALSAGSPFTDVRDRPGFAPTLLRLFRELDLADLSAEDLEAQGGDKMPAIGAMYRGYLQRRVGFAGEADLLRLADPLALGGAPVLLYGVLSLAPLRCRVLEMLAAAGSPVTCILPALPDPAGLAVRRLRTWFEEHGAEVDGRQEPIAATAPAGDLRAISAPDEVREVEAVARACLQWAAAGIPFRDMAVVYRQRAPYAALIDSVLRHANIPVYLYAGRSMALDPRGRALLALMDLHGTDLPRADVLRFLVEAPPGPEMPEDVAAWDGLSREAGVVRGLDNWRRLLAAFAAGKREEADRDPEAGWARWNRRSAAQAEELLAFVERLAERLAAWPAGEAAWDEHLQFLRGAALPLVGGAEEVLHHLDGLANLADLEPRVTFERFRDVTRDAITGLDTAQVDGEDTRFGVAGVNVLDADSARGLRFRCLAVVGLSERSFPPPARQDPLLLDDERSRIGSGLPLRAESLYDEELGFALLQSGAEEHLLLSYARKEGGQDRLPSSFLRAACETRAGRRLRFDEIESLPFVERITVASFAPREPEQSLTPGEFDRALLARAGSDRRALAAVLSAVPAARRARRLWEARWRTLALTAFDGVAGASAGHPRLRSLSGLEETAVSPTRLEEYARCPQGFMLKNLLDLAPPEEPEERLTIDAMERGNLVHHILSRFIEETDAGWTDRPEEAREALRRIMWQEFKRIGNGAGAGYPLLWQVECRRLEADLLQWLEREVNDARVSGLRPWAVEVSFGPRHRGAVRGPHDRDDPVAVPLGEDERLLIKGRIDRIDVDEETGGFRVIDYKTGKTVAPVDALDAGRKLQLPLYLLAASRMLDAGVRLGRSEYYYVSRAADFRRRALSGEDLEDLMEPLAAMLRHFGRGIQAGIFFPLPDGQCDRWCDYRRACPAAVKAVMQRKANDPLLAAFRVATGKD